MKKLIILLLLGCFISVSAQQQTLSTSGTVTIGPEFEKANDNFDELYAELTAQQAIDETASTTLDIGSYRTFLKTITGTQQFTLSNEVQGAVFDVYAATGSGALNAALFTHATKTVIIHIKYDAYDNTKKASISVKILKVTASEITINYFVNQL